jgi:D-alanine-D-alanine ligase
MEDEPVVFNQSDAPLRVIVLAGGDSPEREVSLRSGAAVAAALVDAGHCVTRIDPAEIALEAVEWHGCDACFIALHGGAGEDGRVQQQLDLYGIPYTGSGPETCRLAMSKSAAKQRLATHGVPTLEWCVTDADDLTRGSRAANVARRVAPLGYPLIVKPDAQGSSLGITVVSSPKELNAAILAAERFDEQCLIEPYVVGREFTVALLDERALPPIEIISPERVFSYQAKYESPTTEFRFDFELAERVREEVLRAAVAAGQALGATGLSRVDLIVDNDERVWVLELNTVPGMTARSLAPLAAARAGLDMTALCDLLVRQCLSHSGVA